ncbi:unnamed protein product [Acanthoscelides obtectus]|uniref:Cytochrome b561 domain-containing protein n=1 Tax=Acanthoscelides obtectus TaxID=200917 RepID=A0A9P0PN97_ACAOB|nr:unnamed protein product [Acanthoscelides obtectus]CAK1638674.1 Putative cytochrome b561 [Acanthoscelides obtectus]
MSSESFAQEREQTVGLLSSNMEARAEAQKTKHYKSLYTFTTSVGVGTLILMVFWILHYRGGFSWNTKPDQQFYWHPYLMFLGMLFLYSQSMLVYRTYRTSAKKNLKLAHAGIHFLAFILSVIGLKAVFDSHNYAKPPIPNLYTLHSWIGLITVIIFSIQFLAGFVTFLYPGLAGSIRKAAMPVHTAFGTGLFVLALVAAISGIMEKAIWTLKNEYADFRAEGVVFNFMGIFIALYGVLVLYLVNESDYKRAPLPEDQIALSHSE